MEIFEFLLIQNNTFAKPMIMMSLCSQSGRGVACGQHLVVGWLPEEVKASIISSKNGNWEVKVGIVLPLTLIDDSDFPVYDIYDINQYWIRILVFYLSIWGYSRPNYVNGRFRMSEVTRKSSDWLIFECAYWENTVWIGLFRINMDLILR